MFDDEREIRLHVGLIDRELAYWALHTTDDHGQWQLAMDHTTDPFEEDDNRRRHLTEIMRAWVQYVGRA